ncbi:flavin reductase family protein [Streptomyces sp. NBC_00690]|uniref:flavin reductase family protein n=1 Tax=Streptomyces sp. NBC_00690 TaxID=2975808 RepID=UPI002E2860B0|nr:flavin reductase family protein [Streptomyces sp. NBC_00690]
MIDSAEFRTAMSWVAAPVVVVTATADDRAHGTTISAFSSLSLDPPMVSIALDRGSDLLAMLRATNHFGVNLLASDQQAIATRFARKGPDKFADLSWTSDQGVPRLPDTAGWLVCTAESYLDGGDHVIVLGLVEHVEYNRRPPLVYHDRTFLTCGPITEEHAETGAATARV